MERGSKRRDRKASIPGKRSRRQKAGCAKGDERAHRVQRSEGRLEKLEPEAVVKLMAKDGGSGDLGAMRLLVRLAMGDGMPEVQKRPRRADRSFLLGPGD